MRNRHPRPKRSINPDRVWTLIRTAIIAGSFAVILSAYATATLG